MKILKIACITIAIFIFGFIAWILLSLTLGPSNDYKEVHLPTAKWKHIFDEKVIDNLDYEYSFKSEEGSVVSSFVTKQGQRLIVWQLIPLERLETARIEHLTATVEPEDLTTYSNLQFQQYPFFELREKASIPKVNHLFLKTDNAFIKETKRGEDFIFMSLDFQKISFGTEEKSDDILIRSKSLVKNAQLLFFNKNEKMIFCLLYPAAPEAELSRNQLLDLIKM